PVRIHADSHFAELLRVRYASRLEKLLPSDHHRADEAPLYIGVDRAGRLLSRRAIRNRPRPDLVLADGEEGAQAKQLVGRADETVEGGLSQAEVLADGRRL